MTKQEAIQNLYDADHAILTAPFAKEIAEALGCPWKKVPVEKFVTDPDANNGKGVFMKKPGVGVDARVLAEAIADHHGFSYPFISGRGTGLRVATLAIEKGLGIDGGHTNG